VKIVQPNSAQRGRKKGLMVIGWFGVSGGFIHFLHHGVFFECSFNILFIFAQLEEREIFVPIPFSFLRFNFARTIFRVFIPFLRPFTLVNLCLYQMYDNRPSFTDMVCLQYILRRNPSSFTLESGLMVGLLVSIYWGIP
jgi:hypothetical protein